MSDTRLALDGNRGRLVDGTGDDADVADIGLDGRLAQSGLVLAEVRSKACLADCTRKESIADDRYDDIAGSHSRCHLADDSGDAKPYECCCRSGRAHSAHSAHCLHSDHSLTVSESELGGSGAGSNLADSSADGHLVDAATDGHVVCTNADCCVEIELVERDCDRDCSRYTSDADYRNSYTIVSCGDGDCDGDGDDDANGAVGQRDTTEDYHAKDCHHCLADDEYEEDDYKKEEEECEDDDYGDDEEEEDDNDDDDDGFGDHGTFTNYDNCDRDHDWNDHLLAVDDLGATGDDKYGGCGSVDEIVHLVSVITDDEDDNDIGTLCAIDVVSDDDSSVCLYDAATAAVTADANDDDDDDEDDERADDDRTDHDVDSSLAVSSPGGAVGRGHGSHKSYQGNDRSTYTDDPRDDDSRDSRRGRASSPQRRSGSQRGKSTSARKPAAKSSSDKDSGKKKDKKKKKKKKKKHAKSAPPTVMTYQAQGSSFLRNRITRSCDPQFLSGGPRIIKFAEIISDTLLILCAATPRCHEGVPYTKELSVVLAAIVLVLTCFVLLIMWKSIVWRCPDNCRCLHQQVMYCVFCIAVMTYIVTVHAVWRCDRARKATVGFASICLFVHLIDFALSITMLKDYQVMKSRLKGKTRTVVVGGHKKR